MHLYYALRPIFIVCALALMLGASAAWAQTAARPPALAVVDGRPISAQALEETAWEGFSEPIAEELIRRRVIFDAAELEGVAVSREELEARAKRDYTQAPAVVAQTLGITEDYLWLKIKTDLLLEKIVGRRGRIGADEILAHYNRHREDFLRPARVYLWELVTTEVEAAWNARRRIGAGETFGEVAAEMSVAPSAAEGGELGWMTPVQLGHELLRATAFALEAGQVSNPLAVNGSYYLLQVTEAEPPVHLTLEQAREQIVETLRRERGITPETVLESLLREAEIQMVWPPLQQLAERYEQLQQIRLLVEGETLALSPAPRIEQDKLLAPAQAVAEALGARVSWEPQESRLTARRGARVVVLTAGQASAQVSGQTVTILPPKVEQGVLVAEARVLLEGLGATLRWEAGRRALLVSLPEAAD